MLGPPGHALLRERVLGARALHSQHIVSAPHPDCGSRLAETGASQRMAGSLAHAHALVSAAAASRCGPRARPSRPAPARRPLADRSAARRLGLAVPANAPRCPARRRRARGHAPAPREPRAVPRLVMPREARRDLFARRRVREHVADPQQADRAEHRRQAELEDAVGEHGGRREPDRRAVRPRTSRSARLRRRPRRPASAAARPRARACRRGRRRRSAARRRRRPRTRRRARRRRRRSRCRAEDQQRVAVAQQLDARARAGVDEAVRAPERGAQLPAGGSVRRVAEGETQRQHDRDRRADRRQQRASSGAPPLAARRCVSVPTARARRS